MVSERPKFCWFNWHHNLLLLVDGNEAMMRVLLMMMILVLYPQMSEGLGSKTTHAKNS